MRVLFLITARGGSKRIPGKNLRIIGGLSLIAFKAIAARRSRFCSRLILSTDNRAIQDEGRRYGADVPFTRPAHLATDHASSTDVIRHAVEFVESEGERYDAIMLLEPAAPFATANDFDRAVELMKERQASVVLGVRPANPASLFVGPLDECGRLIGVVDRVRDWQSRGSPALPQEYTMNAALYLIRWDFFKRYGRIYYNGSETYGYPMDPHYSIEIDDPIDLHVAEFMVERGYVEIAHWR